MDASMINKIQKAKEKAKSKSDALLEKSQQKKILELKKFKRSKPQQKPPSPRPKSPSSSRPKSRL